MLVSVAYETALRICQCKCLHIISGNEENYRNWYNYLALKEQVLIKNYLSNNKHP